MNTEAHLMGHYSHDSWTEIHCSHLVLIGSKAELPLWEADLSQLDEFQFEPSLSRFWIISLLDLSRNEKLAALPDSTWQPVHEPDKSLIRLASKFCTLASHASTDWVWLFEYFTYSGPNEPQLLMTSAIIDNEYKSLKFFFLPGNLSALKSYP